MDLALCTGAQSCWNRKGPSPNSFHKVVHQIARWRSVIRHSREHVSTALAASCFTPLQQTLCIALGDLWLGCSCLAMETHSMKLSTHCSWANLKATWSLEVCSDWLCRKWVTSAHYVPQHPLTPLCHFTWPITSWLLLVLIVSGFHLWTFYEQTYFFYMAL